MNSSLDDENQKEEAAELILRVSLLCLNRDIPEAIFKIILKMPFLGFETWTKDDNPLLFLSLNPPVPWDTAKDELFDLLK